MSVLLCLAVTPVRISSVTEHLFPSCTDCHHALHPSHLQQPYWLTLLRLLTFHMLAYINSVLGPEAFLWIRTLRMGPIGCPKMSVRNYHYLLGNNQEEHGFQLLRSRILKLAYKAIFRESSYKLM